MVAKDTVIGIAGAVVLVAAMAGVFVYEYNNVPETGGDDGSFADQYPGLLPDGDLDGDGTPNAEDDDLDGDGIMNADDEDVAFTDSSSGSLGPRAEPGPSPSHTLSANMEEGVRTATATIAWTPTANDPSGALSSVSARLELDDGTVLDQATGLGTFEFSAVDLAPGGIHVIVQPAQGSLGGSYEVTLTVHY